MANTSTDRLADQTRTITVRRVIAAILIVLAIVFIIENRQSVEIRLIVPLATLPLWISLTAVFVIGGVAGWLLARRRASRR